MPEVLEGAQLLEDDRVAEVDVRRGRVHPELHAQLLAARQLLGQASFRQRVDRSREHARERFLPLRPGFSHGCQCYFR